MDFFALSYIAGASCCRSCASARRHRRAARARNTPLKAPYNALTVNANTMSWACAAELRTPPVGATPQNVKTTARTVALDSWEDLQEKLKDGAPPMPGKGFKIPPFLIFMAVIVVLGATSQFGIDVTWPVFILFWLYVLSRMVRSVIGAFRGGKPGQPPQRK